jgi:hypothetical protein
VARVSAFVRLAVLLDTAVLRGAVDVLVGSASALLASLDSTLVVSTEA